MFAQTQPGGPRGLHEERHLSHVAARGLEEPAALGAGGTSLVRPSRLDSEP
jgi:hypothetical protein